MSEIPDDPEKLIPLIDTGVIPWEPVMLNEDEYYRILYQALATAEA